jgi:hypothetical protein
MNPNVVLTAVLLCALSQITSAKPLKVFILAGQSNMQRHVNISTFNSMADDPRTAPILKDMRTPESLKHRAWQMVAGTTCSSPLVGTTCPHPSSSRLYFSFYTDGWTTELG